MGEWEELKGVGMCCNLNAGCNFGGMGQGFHLSLSISTVTTVAISSSLEFSTCGRGMVCSRLGLGP